MKLSVLANFLIGRRNAIEQLAGDRWALAVGFLFVISAGLAREYDAEYLVREPWHVLIPLAASLPASFLFFLMALGIGKMRGIGPVPFWRSYRVFLALFWMTAPLAWLYAIPYERWLDAVSATSANLDTLKVVSIWRVCLMTRIVMVFFGAGIAASFVCVMLVADSVMLIALSLIPRPVISMMGGIHLSGSEVLIASNAAIMATLGLMTLLIWLIGVVMVAACKTPQWKLLEWDRTPQVCAASDGGPARVVPHAGCTTVDASACPPKSAAGLCLAVMAVLVWIPILPWTQREQGLRYMTEQHLKENRIAEALTVMSSHAPADYPPHWDPPPRPGYNIHEPDIAAVFRAMATQPVAPWVRRIYAEKLYEHVESRLYWLDDEELESLLALLETIPEGPRCAQLIRPAVDPASGWCSEGLRERVTRLAQME